MFFQAVDGFRQLLARKVILSFIIFIDLLVVLLLRAWFRHTYHLFLYLIMIGAHSTLNLAEGVNIDHHDIAARKKNAMSSHDHNKQQLDVLWYGIHHQSTLRQKNNLAIMIYIMYLGCPDMQEVARLLALLRQAGI